MTTIPHQAVSHLGVLSPPELQVLRAVTSVQVDGHLSADIVKVRKRAASMDGQTFARAMWVLEGFGLVESEVWPGGWRVWATMSGWVTVIEADEQ